VTHNTVTMSNFFGARETDTRVNVRPAGRKKGVPSKTQKKKRTKYEIPPQLVKGKRRLGAGRGRRSIPGNPKKSPKKGYPLPRQRGRDSGKRVRKCAAGRGPRSPQGRGTHQETGPRVTHSQKVKRGTTIPPIKKRKGEPIGRHFLNRLGNRQKTGVGSVIIPFKT